MWRWCWRTQDADALLRVHGELAHHRQTIEVQQTDVAQAAQVEQLCARSFALLGRVDLLFNNAGVLATGACWELDTAVFERVLNVNLWSVIHSLRVFVPRHGGARQRAHRQHRLDGGSCRGPLACALIPCPSRAWWR
ncbi:SDR family NAD(P)-dependent oxidoreductase [Cupriavidus basilensis]